MHRGAGPYPGGVVWDDHSRRIGLGSANACSSCPTATESREFRLSDTLYTDSHLVSILYL